jgi:hypothetical protein
LTGGINYTNVSQIGSLRFLSHSTAVTQKNPRDTSVHTFRVTFDNAQSLTASPIQMTGTPVIYVYFPSEYHLAWYNAKPSATIEEYTSDASSVITKTQTISPASVTTSGNRVTITLSPTSYKFDLVNWRYWDIKITNIVNPTDTTSSQGPPVTQTTRPFQVTLANTTLTQVFQTYSNVNTYASDVMNTAYNHYLSWNRGNGFVFDNTKWVIDIYSAPTQLNTLTIKAGRFLKSFFTVKQ